MKTQKIIIIGAGPAGLAAAYKLVTRGFKVKIIEKEERVGGQSTSLNKDNFIFDLGGHRFYTKNKELLEEINIITNNLLKPRNRYSQILWNGKYYDYPLSFETIIKNLPIGLIINCVWDFLKATIRKFFIKKNEISFDQWVINRFGRKLYDIYFGPYTEKVWGMSPELLSSEWAAKRISLLNLWDTFIRLFFQPKRVSHTYLKDFYYPDLGIGQLYDSIAENIVSYGGEILKGYEVKELCLASNTITKIKYSSNGKTIEEECDYLLSTAPINELINMITPSVNGIIKKSAEKLKFKSIVFLFLQISKENLTKCNWLYFPDKEIIFFRIIEFLHWSDKMSPKGKTGICCEIGCNYNDEIWNSTDKELFDKVISSLQSTKLLYASEVEGYFSYRLKHAYPIYTIDYKNDLSHLMRFVSEISNLYSFGRQGSFNYSTMDHSMDMGFQVADFLLHARENNFKNKYQLMYHDLGEIMSRY